MEFVIVGETVRPKDEIENKIKQMGGKLIENMHENVAAIISNPEEVSTMGPAMEEAKTKGIHVIPETFIDNVKHIDPIKLIVTMDLSNWGQNVWFFSTSIETFRGLCEISFQVNFHF